MTTIFPSLLIATAISLVLQTNYRLSPEVGLGEIGLALVIGYAIARCFATPERTPSLREQPLALVILTYLLAIVLPVTVLNALYHTFGTEFRDLLAYLLCALTTFALATQPERSRQIALMILVITLTLVSLQYLFGSQTTAWYGLTRFTGGARNPNQLALYLVCLTLITAIHVQRPLLKLLVFALLVFFGLASESDAFHAYMALTLGVLLLSLIIPSRYFLLVAPLLLMLVLIFVFFFIDDIQTVLGKQWSLADQGGSRLTLYANGLRAWLHNPLTMVLGNGAGNFSGLHGPFQGWESHNTPIDILTVGGLLGLLAIYFFPIKCALDVYRLDQRLVFACTVGLIGFTFFHFVARHPIFWVTLFVLYQHIQDHREVTEPCAA